VHQRLSWLLLGTLPVRQKLTQHNTFQVSFLSVFCSPADLCQGMPLMTAHCTALPRLLALHACPTGQHCCLFSCNMLWCVHISLWSLSGNSISAIKDRCADVTGEGMGSDHVDSKSIQHTKESWSSQPDSAVILQAIEEQGLRQSYGSDPSRSHRISGASVPSIEHETAAFGSVPRRLSTIVSGVSASGTPSAAEMHGLQSQVQHLP